MAAVRLCDLSRGNTVLGSVSNTVTNSASPHDTHRDADDHSDAHINRNGNAGSKHLADSDAKPDHS